MNTNLPLIEPGVLGIGVDASAPLPLHSDPNLPDFKGFEVDLMKAVAARVGVSVSYKNALTPAAGRFIATSPDRKRHALIGGAIGAALGLAVCTVISTLADDSADGGLSTCPVDTYLLFGAAGFGLGFAIGWAI
jgi:ABC-type amino acid transport substrate-binding protein